MVDVPLVCQLAVVFMSQVPLVAPVQVTGAAVPLVTFTSTLLLAMLSTRVAAMPRGSGASWRVAKPPPPSASYLTNGYWPVAKA